MPGAPSRYWARSPGRLGLQERSRSSSCVESALCLGEAGPTAGTGVLAGLDPAGARLAADRRVAVREKGVDLDTVLGGIRKQLVEGPRGERVDLHEAVLLVPGDQGRVGAGRGLLATHPGDPRLVGRQRPRERFDLAHLAAERRVAFVEAGAVLLVLLGDGEPRQDIDDG